MKDISPKCSFTPSEVIYFLILLFLLFLMTMKAPDAMKHRSSEFSPSTNTFYSGLNNKGVIREHRNLSLPSMLDEF